jgi:hypothetical protein
MSPITKNTTFFLILLLGFILSGCKSETAGENTVITTAVSYLTGEPTATNTPIATNPPPQPSNTPRLLTSTPSLTSPSLPTTTPAAAPIDWDAIRNGATVLYYHDQDLWRSSPEGEHLQALTEGNLLASWAFETIEGNWWSGGFMPWPFVSPDGRFIAFTQTGRNMVIVDVTASLPPQILSSGSILMAWSPNSRYLAYDYNSALYIYDTLTNHFRVRTPISERGPQNITWSPDGRYVGFVCCFTPPEGEYEGVEYGYIKQYDMETGLIDTVGEAISSIGGGPEFICWQDADYFTPHQEAQQTDHCTVPGNVVFSGSYSPAGPQYARIQSTTPDNPLYLQLIAVDGASEAILWEIELDEAANRIAWSLDGRYLLFNNNYPSLSPIWRLPADGSSRPEPLTGEAYLIDVIPMWQETQ